MGRNMTFLFLGGFFGWVLSRTGASEYDLIHGMFAGTDLTLAYLMGSAIVVGALGMVILKRTVAVTRHQEPIEIERKPLQSGTIWGGLVFGVGWTLSGACPGTVLAQLGEGKVWGLVTVAGLLLGTYLYALWMQRQPES